MLHAIGLNESDLKKPFVGIASTGYEGNPCNMHLNHLSCEIKKGIKKSNLTGLIFNTIGVLMEFPWAHLECVFLFIQEM